MIAVGDVTKSSAWYAKLLNAQTSHPGATVFDQVLDGDCTVLLCLHHWGPSGRQGDHWAPFSHRDLGAGNGLLLWFVVDDFEATWKGLKRWAA